MSGITIWLGIVTGVALASVYVLIAISMTLVLASSGIFNFAQGTIVMIGTVFAYLLGVKLGWTPLWVAAAVLGCGMLAGLFTHLVAVLPAIGRSKSFTHTTILTTIGLGFAANAIAVMWFGGDSYRVPAYLPEDPIVVFSIPIRPTYLLMIVVGAVITLSVEWLIRRTELGYVFRATLEDPEGAGLLGINVNKVIAITFAIAGAMSGLAGFLVAPVISASALSAHEMAFYGFAGMAAGGFGSFAGALAGGLVVGLIAGIVPAIGDPRWALPLIWLAVVVVLLVKPSGLFGTAGLFGASRFREV